MYRSLMLFLFACLFRSDLGNGTATFVQTKPKKKHWANGTKAHAHTKQKYIITYRAQWSVNNNNNKIASCFCVRQMKKITTTTRKFNEIQANKAHSAFIHSAHTNMNMICMRKQQFFVRS